MNINKINQIQADYDIKLKTQQKIQDLVDVQCVNSAVDLFIKNAAGLIMDIPDDELDEYLGFLMTEFGDRCLKGDKILIPIYFLNEASVSTSGNLSTSTQLTFYNRYFAQERSSNKLELSDDEQHILTSTLRGSSYFSEDDHFTYNIIFNKHPILQAQSVDAKLEDQLFSVLKSRLFDYGLKNIQPVSITINYDDERTYRFNYEIIVSCDNFNNN